MENDTTSLDLSILPWVPLQAKLNLPELQSVYFVLGTANEVLYVGKAINLRQRWNVGAHHKMASFLAFPDVRIAWLPVREADRLAAVETQYIDHFHPRLNTQGNFQQYHQGIKSLCTIQLEQAEHDALRAAAREQKRTVAAVIRMALAPILARATVPATGGRKRGRRAMAPH